MIPDFSTWYAEQNFKPGTRVRVTCGGAYQGRETTITRIDFSRGRVWVVSFESWTPEQNGRIESFEVIDAP